MKALLVVLAFAVVVVAAVASLRESNVGPAPIVHGRDACAHCRMHVGRPGFAGELRDDAGVLTKYDDLGCMLRAMRAMGGRVPDAWVEDHASFALVPLSDALLVRARGVQTPMGSGLVAFRDARTAEDFARGNGGEIVSLEDILRDAAGPGATVPGPQHDPSTDGATS